MSRVCTVCQHEAKGEIDKALVAGEANRRIATQHGLTESALRRHKKAHLPAALVKAKEAREVTDADSLLLDVRRLRSKAVQLLLLAEAAGDLKTALLGVREARSCIELLAELMHELDRRPQVNVLLSAEWVQVRDVIVEALAGFPEARLVVAAKLMALEATSRGSGD